MPALRTLVLVALLAPVAHTPLAAQDSTLRQRGLLVGAGVNLARDARPGDGIPLALEIGYEWARRSAPLGLRLTADYAATRGLVSPLGYAFQQAGTVTTRTRDLSLGVAGVYALHTGRFEPYLLSGVALQQRSLAHEVSTPGGGDIFRGTLYSAGLQAGLGLRAHLGRSTLFIEARTYAPVFGDVAGRRTATSPLTAGLRF